jgi:hypothetical protein
MGTKIIVKIILAVVGMGLSGLFILFGSVGVMLLQMDDNCYAWPEIVLASAHYLAIAFGIIVGVSGVMLLRKTFIDIRNGNG